MGVWGGREGTEVVGGVGERATGDDEADVDQQLGDRFGQSSRDESLPVFGGSGETKALALGQHAGTNAVTVTALSLAPLRRGRIAQCDTTRGNLCW
ncbi:hypothetical protein ACGFZA_42080 [Streptomyces sp. NPDC048211]|uniref:hypothetical protein n=1 Tax=Streptomyces sp. NPDC048211 TaxID=3365516 RepID=UPI00372362CA